MVQTRYDLLNIHMSMPSFVDKIRTINVPKGVDSETPRNDAQIRILRAATGSLNWLSNQTRPDLAVRTSLSVCLDNPFQSPP